MLFWSAAGVTCVFCKCYQVAFWGTWIWIWTTRPPSKPEDFGKTGTCVSWSTTPPGPTTSQVSSGSGGVNGGVEWSWEWKMQKFSLVTCGQHSSPGLGITGGSGLSLCWINICVGKRAVCGELGGGVENSSHMTVGLLAFLSHSSFESSLVKVHFFKVLREKAVRLWRNLTLFEPHHFSGTLTLSQIKTQ